LFETAEVSSILVSIPTGSDSCGRSLDEGGEVDAKRILSAVIVFAGALAAAAINGGFGWGP
jgi:hypothetical protein